MAKERSRQRHVAMVRAARMLQAVVRARLHRRRVRAMRRELRKTAAAAIQRAWRRALARATLCKERARQGELARQNAALLMQRSLRGDLSRRMVQRMRQHEAMTLRAAAALQVQRSACADRAERLGVCDTASSLTPSVCLPSVYRGALGRRLATTHTVHRHFERQLRAVLVVQRMARGMLGRRLTERMSRYQWNDVFTQARLGDLERLEQLVKEAGACVRGCVGGGMCGCVGVVLWMTG